MLRILQKALDRFAKECLAAGYEVLLEADATGWLFHILLEDPDIRPHDVHLSARVCGVEGFLDVALGPVDTETAKRPCVRPSLAVEVKVFPRTGFTPQQHRVHYNHVLDDDLPRLGTLTAADRVGAQVLVDGAGYLEGRYAGVNRKEHLVRTRDKVAPDAHIFVVRLTGRQWEVEHVPPHK